MTNDDLTPSVSIDGAKVLGACIKGAVSMQATVMAGSAVWQTINHIPKIKVAANSGVLLGGCAFGAISNIAEQINGEQLTPDRTPACPKGYNCIPDR
jgi:hypothetical protein